MRMLWMVLFVALQLWALPARAEGAWVGSWRAASQPVMGDQPLRLQQQTLRLILRPTLAGRALRVRLSNRFGTEPVEVAAAQLALHRGEGRLRPDSRRGLRFNGAVGVRLAAGAEVWSDPLDMDLAAGEALAVDLYFAGAVELSTVHTLAQQTSYLLPGDARTRETPGPRIAMGNWPLLTGLDVQPVAAAQALLLFGDSQVDGDGSTEDADQRLGDQLARQFRREARAVGVLNEGLIGNRLLRDAPRDRRNPTGAAFGPSGLARAVDAAAGASGARVVLLHLGTNDLGLPGTLADPAEAANAVALIQGQRQLAARMREQGLRVVASTLAPFARTTLAKGYHTPAKEKVRVAVNEWLRAHASEFDGLLDFDRVLRDPAHPDRLRPAYDSGDHLHPNDAGYAALARAFPRRVLDLTSTAKPALS